jgi:hypothetical protein
VALFRQSGIDVKLYRSTKDTRWFTFGPEIGWMMFPAEVGGWKKRQPASAADIGDMREVPLCMGFNTGIPGAPSSATGGPDVALGQVTRITEKRTKSRRGICLIRPVSRTA